jgi:7-cyano-7-deazaguanine synthase
MGGPDMAPQTPQRSSHPGQAGAGLDTRRRTSPRAAVTLLSGGLDSTTTLAVARRDGFECYALTIDYGQRHRVELDAARAVAARLGVRGHVIVPLDLRPFGGSALTADIAVPKGRAPGDMTDIPVTYVPARNTIFLALALAWAETLGAEDIFIGVNALDSSGYPDCRPEFIDAFERAANLGTKAGVEGKRSFTIHTPLIALTKADIVSLAVGLGVDLSVTWSCYDPTPDERPCGACDSCVLRAKGFREAGIVDPLA